MLNAKYRPFSWFSPSVLVFYCTFLLALMTYFWAVVQHLYRKLGEPNSDEENLIKGPDFVKEPKGPIVFK